MSDHTPHLQLEQFQAALHALERGEHSAARLSEQARAHTALLSALPPRYTEVLHNLLDRLESSALFSEESCSFSQKDLLDSLRVWAGKVGEMLSNK